VHPLLASFLDVEGPAAAGALRQAVLDRRHGRRLMSFNCFDVTIDAHLGTVLIEDAIDPDGGRTSLSVSDVLRDLS
jgi:hypothetical protein